MNELGVVEGDVVSDLRCVARFRSDRGDSFCYELDNEEETLILFLWRHNSSTAFDILDNLIESAKGRFEEINRVYDRSAGNAIRDHVSYWNLREIIKAVERIEQR